MRTLGPPRASPPAHHPQVILMLMEKCRKQQEDTAEVRQLRLLLRHLEQNFAQLQKDIVALRCAG